MCGIVGFDWSDKKALARAVGRLSHRGPDDEGVYVDERVSLGHRRLSIIDLSSAGRQPMSSGDGRYLLVFNGEIYNYVELREELERLGYRFTTSTDTEAIMWGYDAWGAGCLDRFNGMFAFSIYDRKEGLFFLARDRFGVKPLHYRYDGGRFIFSSEIKPILDIMDRPLKPHEPAIYDYLLYNFYNHDSHTFFEGVSSLLPGHYLIYTLGEKRLLVKQWYDIPLDRQWGGDFEDATARFREIFVDAVRLRLRSDVEVGTCLSGGLDSSSIVCNLKNFDARFAEKFKSFSVVFNDPAIDESPYMEAVINDVGVEGFFVRPDLDDLLQDLDSLVAYQEEPFGGTSIFAQWCVMKLAREKGVKVLLDGQGGDELMGGYPFFFGYLFLERLRHLDLSGFLREVRGYRSHFREADGLLVMPLLLAPKKLKAAVMARYFRNVVNREFAKRYVDESSFPSLMYSATDLRRALYNRVKYSLPQLLREEDRNSMAFAIEARLPFLDYRLVEFCFSLASEHKLHEGVSKRVLREAMKDILPPKIYGRTLKLGFPTPMSNWMRDERLAGMVEHTLFSGEAGARGYYDMESLRKVFDRHRTGAIDAPQIIWKVFNLELWFRSFFS